MPEGDTIARSADVLRAALVGQRVTAAAARPLPGMRSVPDLSRLVGRAVTAVESRGKHLLIRFETGDVLRTHLRMRGSWHRYRPGERWRRPERNASVVIETPAAVVVAFSAPVVELLSEGDVRRSRALATLGPDLLAGDFDLHEAVARLRLRAGEQLGNALLDQRAVAGIGNVYKSEVAFIEGMSPWLPISAFDDDELRGALTTARRLMSANRGGGARITTGNGARGHALWVYGRARRPCRRCGTAIEVARQGPQARLTFWCPRCQPDGVERVGGAGAALRPRSG